MQYTYKCPLCGEDMTDRVKEAIKREQEVAMYVVGKTLAKQEEKSKSVNLQCTQGHWARYSNE